MKKILLMCFSLAAFLALVIILPLSYARVTSSVSSSATSFVVAPTSAIKSANQSLINKSSQAVNQTEAILTGKTLVARVVWVKGKFSASMPGSNETRELKKDSNIYMNDTLITDATSEAEIVYSDNSVMTFRPNTQLYINEYNYAPKTAAASKKSVGKYVMDLITGGFRTITGWVAKDNPGDYQINTPVATIGVRGTEFSVVYQTGKDLYVKRYKGIPCVRNKGKNRTELCMNQVNPYADVANADTAPVAVGEQPEVFRTDVEVIPVNFVGDNPSGLGGVSGFCIQ